jgi:hypothetical protein
VQLLGQISEATVQRLSRDRGFDAIQPNVKNSCVFFDSHIEIFMVEQLCIYGVQFLLKKNSENWPENRD